MVHTAAALPLYSPKDIYTTDVEGTRMLLEVAYKHKVQRFVMISSTAVYGIPDHHPLYETDKLEGVGPYGQAKIQAEMVCLEYRGKGMVVPIIRPKSFIGPERLGVFAMLYDWAMDGPQLPHDRQRQEPLPASRRGRPLPGHLPLHDPARPKWSTTPSTSAPKSSPP